jgi:hypothetical protein
MMSLPVKPAVQQQSKRYVSFGVLLNRVIATSGTSSRWVNLFHRAGSKPAKQLSEWQCHLFLWILPLDHQPAGSAIRKTGRLVACNGRGDRSRRLRSTVLSMFTRNIRCRRLDLPRLLRCQRKASLSGRACGGGVGDRSAAITVGGTMVGREVSMTIFSGHLCRA